MRAVFIALRLVGAGLIVAAVVAQFTRSLGIWTDAGVGLASQTVNFFSFFTIQSNLLSLAVFLVGAVRLLRRRDDGRPFAVFRGSVTAYMATTGIVYNLLLRGIELPQGTTVPWSNEILHVVAPLLLVVDWLFAPGRRPLDWRDIRVVVAYPLAWAAYTMIRGPLVADDLRGTGSWYPYPFLNPQNSENGYLSVAFYVVLIAVVIGLVGAGVIWVSRRRMGSRPADLGATT